MGYPSKEQSPASVFSSLLLTHNDALLANLVESKYQSNLKNGETMATLDRAVQELQSERSRLQTELQRIDAALNALNSLNGAGRVRGRRHTAQRGAQRHFSAAARRRMAAAQKARWAKLRQQRLKKAA